MAGLKIEFPSVVDPVDLTLTKNFLRVDDIDDDDDLITTFISAATILAENWCRRAFITKGFIETLDSFPYFTDTLMSQMAYPPSYYSLPRYSTTLWNYSQMIKVFRPPLKSVDRITYCDSGSRSFQDLVPQPTVWYPQHLYTVGQQVMDNNGNIQTLAPTDPCTTDTMMSGIVPPAEWNKDREGMTYEASPATAVWRNDGPSPQGEFGSFIADGYSEPGRIFPGINTPNLQPVAGYWPSVLYIPDAVQIHFTAGFGPTMADIPANARVAILQLVADMYENRTPTKDDEEQLPKHVRQLLWPLRVLDFAPTRG